MRLKSASAMREINVRYNEEEGRMIHPGPPFFYIGQPIELIGRSEFIGSFYIEDVVHNAETNITSYSFRDEPFYQADLNDLLDKDTNRD
jgi:hypothetical protein